MANPNDVDPPPPAEEEIPSTAPQALWPRYAVLSEALKLSHDAAEAYNVHKRPTLEWTMEEILLVALATLRETR